VPEEVTFQELIAQNRALQAENERLNQEINLLEDSAFSSSGVFTGGSTQFE
jgi:cell division protein FtsB